MNGNQIFWLLMVVLGLGSLVFVFHDTLVAYWVGLLRQRRFRFMFQHFARAHDYLYLSNITLRVDQGHYLTVDHLLLGDHFLYVMNVKFWFGYVSGSTEDEKWMLTDGKTLEYIDNPCRANEVRTNLLVRMLGIDRDNFVSLVILAKSARIDSMKAVIPKWHVIDEVDVIPFLKNQEKMAEVPPYRPDELEKIAERIYDYHQKSEEERQRKPSRFKRKK